MVLSPMADRWTGTAVNYSFRFFAPEQIDEILCQGARHGRTGSHDAIERILKHEPGLERAELWSRIRRLKYPKRKTPGRRIVWSPEDDQLLRIGYESGVLGKREVIRALLNRHPDWRPYVIWKRASRLGLIQRKTKRGEERRRHNWSEDDDRILLNLAGEKSLRVIARILHRSERAVCCRLALLGKKTRVQLDGYARRALAEELHMGRRTIQKLIVEGFLEVRDPRITPVSLASLRKSRLLMGSLFDTTGEGAAQGAEDAGVMTGCNGSPPASGATTAMPPRSSRAKQLWAEIARTLNVGVKTVEDLIAQGLLKLYDPRITEGSFKKFCRRHGAIINYDFLNRETKEWLRRSMDLDRGRGADVAKRLMVLRKHAMVVRECTKCGREIRGNAFFRHRGMCGQDNSRTAETGLLLERPGRNAMYIDQKVRLG